MKRIDPLGSRLDLRHGCVDLSHGAGGRAMSRLIADIFHASFDNEWLRAGNDQSAFNVDGGAMVMTTDGYVASPLFFPGKTSAVWRFTARSMISQWREQSPYTCPRASFLRRGFRSGSAAHRQEYGRRLARSECPYHHRRHQSGGARQGRRRFHLHRLRRPRPRSYRAFWKHGARRRRRSPLWFDRRSRGRHNVTARVSSVQKPKFSPTRPRCMIWWRE